MMIITKVEDAIIAETKLVLPNLLRAVEQLPGGAWSRDTFARVLQSAPAIYVLFRGAKQPAQMSDVLLDARFDVYAVAQSASLAARSRGAKNAIGLYEILERLSPRLNALTVPDVGTLKLLNITPMFTEQLFKEGGMVHAMQFEVPMQWPVLLSDDFAAIKDFKTYHATHDIDGAGTAPTSTDQATLP